jgi:hypothetical protein
MDTGKDIQASSAAAPSASDVASPALASATPAVEPAQSHAPKAETAAPAAADAAIEIGSDADKPAGRPDAPREGIKLVAFDYHTAERATMSSKAPMGDDASRRRQFALLAASIALAVALGAVAGAVGVSSFAQAPPPPPPAVTAAKETPAVQSTLAQMRSEIAAIKSSIETSSRATNGQLSKITERFDRVERAQTERTAKLAKVTETLERLERRADAAPAKDTTASLPAAQPVAATPAPPAVVAGWVVRDVYRGMAVIQGRRMGMIEVQPGDVVPGIGRIESIKKQDGRWVVVTPKGLITSSTR